MINSSLDIPNETERLYHYRFFKDKNISSIASSPVVRSGNKIKKYSSVIFALLIAMLPGLIKFKCFRSILNKCFSENYTLAFENYSKADIIISKGGHKFVSIGGLSGLITLFINVIPLIIGVRFKKPVVIYSQSIGPFKDHYSKVLARMVFNRINKIYLREKISLLYVQELLNSSDDRLQFAWDTAFAIKGLPVNPLNITKPYVVFTVRQWNFPENKNESDKLFSEYINKIIGVAKFLATELGYLPVFVPQVIGPTKLENDLLVIDMIVTKIGDDFHYKYFKNDFSVQELANIYASAEFVIGTRFHSVILALAAGTPSLAISYYGFKTKGIMEMLGLGKYVLDIYNLPDLEDFIVEYVGNLPEIRNEVRSKTKDIYKDSQESVSRMLELVYK